MKIKRKDMAVWVVTVALVLFGLAYALAGVNRPIMIDDGTKQNVTGVSKLYIHDEISMKGVSTWQNAPTAGQFIKVSADGLRLEGIAITTAVTGSGAVDAGAYKSIAYYPAAAGESGATVAPLGQAASSVLVTSGVSTPSLSQTLPNEVQINSDHMGISGATKVFINATGVGLGGVSEPQQALHVRAESGGSAFAQFTTDGLGMASTDGLLVGLNSGGSAYVKSQENGPLILGTNGLGRMFVSPDGPVFVGSVQGYSSHGGSGGTLFYLYSTDANQRHGIGVLQAPAITVSGTTDYIGINARGDLSVTTGYYNAGYYIGIASAAYAQGGGAVQSVYGIRSNTGIAPDGIGGVSNAYGVQTRVLNQGSSAYILNGYGLRVQDVQAKDAGYGLYISGVTGAASYGIYLADVGGNNVTAYGVYQAGVSDFNYFAGPINTGREVIIGGLATSGVSSPLGATAFMTWANIGVTPTGLVGGAGLFAFNNELYALDAAGNVTQLSAHDQETGESIHRSFNVYTGRGKTIWLEQGNKTDVFTVEKVNPESVAKERWLEEWTRKNTVKVEVAVDKAVVSVAGGDGMKLADGVYLNNTDKKFYMHVPGSRINALKAAEKEFRFEWKTLPRFVRDAWGR